MKYFVITLLLLSIVLSAHAKLTSDDLLKISEIVNKAVKESENQMKAEIKASETRMKEYVDTNFDGLGKRVSDTKNLSYAIIALIGVAIGLPSWRDRKDRKLEAQLQKQVEFLTAEIEALKNGQTQSPQD